MQIIRSPADADALDPELSQLIADTFARVADCPEILGFVLVVEQGDTITDIDAQLGFSILGGRHEFILEHAKWFELVYLVGQEDGLELFVPKTEGINPDLLAICLEHALPAESMP